MKKLIGTAFVAAANLRNSVAFSPVTGSQRSSTAIGATFDRRELLGNFVKAIGTSAAVAAGIVKIDEDAQPILLAGLTNPAGASFRGKFKGQSFTPGKGMRLRDSVDDFC